VGRLHLDRRGRGRHPAHGLERRRAARLAPDGEWIVFQGHENEPPNLAVGVAIHRSRPDGSDREQLTTPDGSNRDYYPQWLPDGSAVIYNRCIVCGPATLGSSFPTAPTDCCSKVSARRPATSCGSRHPAGEMGPAARTDSSASTPTRLPHLWAGSEDTGLPRLRPRRTPTRTPAPASPPTARRRASAGPAPNIRELPDASSPS
jgi:hypothetical protein